MDPLSVSLAVISVATALKDLVEVGQRIHESFAKVSGNYRKAQSVARDIKEMVDEIKEFCEVHEKELDNVKDFRLALSGLLGKLKDFERSVLPLLPRTGGRKLDRLTRAWKVWRDNNKIEEGILDVQSEVVKVMRRYMLKSTMRAEIVLGRVHQETSQGLAGISQGLEVLDAVRRDVSVIRVTTAGNLNPAARGSYESSASGSNDISRQIIKFAQSTSSTSAPMLQMADVIPEEIMTAAFIKQQVVHLVKALTKMPKSRSTTPNDINHPFSPNFKYSSLNIIYTQRSVVRDVLDLREMVERGSMQTFPTMAALTTLRDLSAQIYSLPHMHQEAIQVGAWATTLVRPLIDSNVGGADTRAELCLSLCTQSQPYYAIGDEIQSSQLITEAFSIASDLWNQFDGDSRFQILYSLVLAHYTRLVDTQTSIDLFNEALQALGDSFSTQVQGFSQLQLPHNLNTDAAQHSVINGLLSSLSISEMTAFAGILIQLADCYSKDGQSLSALGLRRVAITVCRHVVSTQGYDGHKEVLADLLLWVVKNEEARDLIAIELLIDMANEGILLYRELAECNPELFARQLIHILREKALILKSVKPDTREILLIWEEIVSLARDIVGDSREQALHNLARQFRHLEMYEDAVQTLTLSITAYQYEPEYQASRYGMLSNNLWQLHRYKEATEASQKSVALHRHMALRDPGGTHMGALAAGLSDLTYRLAASGDSLEALMTWREFTSMLDNFLNTNTDASTIINSDYLAALRIHDWITLALDNEEGSLMVSSTVIQYYHRLSEMCCPHDFSITMDVLHANFSYVYHLLRFGHLQDAQRYIEDWGDRWQERMEATSHCCLVAQHIAMIGLKCKVLDAQGRTREALAVNQQAEDIMWPCINSQHASHPELINPVLYRAQLQLHLGNSKEALQDAEMALRIAQDGCLELTVNPPVQSLHGVASTALFCQDYERASEVALEGCKICATSNWQDKESELNVLLRPSLLALLSSAEANLGRHSIAVEYANKAVEVSLDIRETRIWRNITATTAEQSYMETRGNLAEILIVTGKLEEARQICEEQRDYFAKRVDKRMGEYRDLVPILRVLGILCCSEGRHDEGNDAAQELLRIMNALASAFPSLRDQVKIRLRHQTQVPILEVLNNMCRKLDCEHQAEVASTFEV